MAYRYKCTTCEAWHEGFPELQFRLPQMAAEIPESERSEHLFLAGDLCVVDNQYFFIRCWLPLRVQGASERFGWSVWTSSNQADFLRYQKHYHEDMSDWAPMSGDLANVLPEYPDTHGLHLSIQPQRQGKRPVVTVEPCDHPLYIDQREGIPLDKVLRLVDPYLHK